MSKKRKTNYDWNITLGDILEETITSYNYTIEEFAEKINIPYIQLKNIIENKELITLEIAKKFEKVINTSSTFWMNLQNDYLSNEQIKQKIKVFKCNHCNRAYYKEKQKIGKMDIQYCENCNKIMYSIDDRSIK